MATDEAARLKDWRHYKILDTEPEQSFDDLTLIASQICATPIALITLVDKDRQWFKSTVGVAVQETSRDVSFCAHAIQQQGVFTVRDALEDARFRENPLVQGHPHIRFYAGSPITTRDGHALGTLCVIDYVPRELTNDQNRALQALQRQVEAQLELRRNIDELRAALGGIEMLADLIPYCSTCELNVVMPADPAAMEKVTAGLNELLAGKQVQCCITFDAAGELVVVIRDPGTGFDPKAVPDPLEGKNLFRASGRGVFLINELMDTVEFTEGGRQLSMRKRPTP